MASVTTTKYVAHVPATNAERVASVLHWTYAILPLAAGADKFTHILTNWNKYLAPAVANMIDPNVFMSIVGVIEMIAGVLVIAKPRIGSLVVGFWLVAIALNLLLTGQYYDVAVRDLVIAVGAFSLHYLLRPDQTH